MDILISLVILSFLLLIILLVMIFIGMSRPKKKEKPSRNMREEIRKIKEKIVDEEE